MSCVPVNFPSFWSATSGGGGGGGGAQKKKKKKKLNWVGGDTGKAQGAEGFCVLGMMYSWVRQGIQWTRITMPVDLPMALCL